jgi:hypothetical protein
VKEIEKQDSVLTPGLQIDRLTRPGATYFNLNPFDVGIECFYHLKLARNEEKVYAYPINCDNNAAE